MINKILHEQLSIHQASPLVARTYNYPRFSYPWHFHNAFEIIYIKESTGQRFVADSMGFFAPGDVILLGHNVPHYVKSDPPYEVGDETLRAKGVIIQFEKEFLNHAIQNYPHLAKVKQLLAASARGIYFPSTDNEKVITYIEQLPTQHGVEQITTLLLLLEKMAQVENKTILGSEQYSNSLSTATDNRLEKILSYITLHYVENITITHMAELVAMNPTAFCRYFKEKCNKTFFDYILELRIQYACNLLKSDTMDITQISLTCGFNTTSHFNRIFKRIMQQTPSDYKREQLTTI